MPLVPAIVIEVIFNTPSETELLRLPIIDGLKIIQSLKIVDRVFSGLLPLAPPQIVNNLASVV